MSFFMPAPFSRFRFRLRTIMARRCALYHRRRHQKGFNEECNWNERSPVIDLLPAAAPGERDYSVRGIDFDFVAAALGSEIHGVGGRKRWMDCRRFLLCWSCRRKPLSQQERRIPSNDEGE